MSRKLPGKYQRTFSVVIEADVESVWSVLADFGNVQTWAPQVTHSYSLDGPESGPGAARHCDIKGFGGIDEFVTDWQDGRSFAYRVTPVGPIGESHSRWSVRRIDRNKTEVNVEMGYDMRFGLLGSVLNTVMVRAQLRKGLGNGLLALKRRVETGALVRPPAARPQSVEAA